MSFGDMIRGENMNEKELIEKWTQELVDEINLTCNDEHQLIPLEIENIRSKLKFVFNAGQENPLEKASPKTICIKKLEQDPMKDIYIQIFYVIVASFFGFITIISAEALTFMGIGLIKLVFYEICVLILGEYSLISLLYIYKCQQILKALCDLK